MTLKIFIIIKLLAGMEQERLGGLISHTSVSATLTPDSITPNKKGTT